MEISKYLKELSEYFDEFLLYAVGGAPRAALMSVAFSDIDLASAFPAEKIIEKLKNSPYKVSFTSPKMGTIKISRGEESWEYTTFRKESYTKGHTPENVEFISDLNTDAKRRDFRANAVYYDIKNGKYIDPLGGIPDIKNRVLIMTRESAFSEDGLRIMRLIRQAAELNFTIEEKTFCAAKENVTKLQEISRERIRDELDKILIADTKYPTLNTKDAHYRGLKLLIEIGAMNIVLPELMEGEGLLQNEKYHVYDVLEHTLKAVLYAPPSIRLAALFHDIAKPPIMKKEGNAHGHDKLGADMTRQIMERLRYSKQDISKTARLVAGHMYDLKEEAKETTLRRFIQKNNDLIKDLVALKKADGLASGKIEKPPEIRMEKVFYNMLKENIPMSVGDLILRGEDLLALNIEPEKIGTALSRLLEDSVLKKKTEKEEIAFVKSHKKEFSKK